MADDDSGLIDRAFWRVMPLAALCFVAAVIDKANIGFAKLQMAKSLGLSETAFGFGASLFFAAFILFEVPSALAAHRFGARLWIARIMASWGAITVLMAFGRSETLFYLLRCWARRRPAFIPPCCSISRCGFRNAHRRGRRRFSRSAARSATASDRLSPARCST